MDGTVLDTLADLLLAMNHALREHGLGERTQYQMRSYVGNGLYMMAARAV
ncbi:MAG: HAD family hydrolase, partial [Clostridia bacterium]|nr:HAD family hydrolase [Clostridia bacterium]